MKKFCFLLEIFLFWISVSSSAFPAPLDAFLSADTHMKTGEGRLELAYDAVNSTLDIFKIRASDPVYGGTNVGDYSGLHLRGSYALTDRLSVDGGFWRRKIDYRGDKQSLSSWQTAAQYRFFEGGYWKNSSYALRVSAWGNSAGSLSKTTPTTLQGQTLNTVNVGGPQDKQLQMDLLGTWRIGDRTYWTAFAGAGTSRVTVDSLSATNITAINGNNCHFNLSFTATGGTATLAAPCGNILGASITIPTNVFQELAYDASYYQAGAMLQWYNNDWQLTGGYHFQNLNRSGIDSIIASRGGVAYKTNHIVAGEIMRKIGRKSAAFMRGQVMSNQFVGEIPFAYNSVTASKFDRRYGFASFGILFAL